MLLNEISFVCVRVCVCSVHATYKVASYFDNENVT